MQGMESGLGFEFKILCYRGDDGKTLLFISSMNLTPSSFVANDPTIT